MRAPCAWCKSTCESTNRNGRPSVRSRRRSAVRLRRCANGFGKTRRIAASGRVQQRPNWSASRSWNASFDRSMRSCVRRPRISCRRSSTAVRNDGVVYRRAARVARSRVDLQGTADRAVDVLSARCAARCRTEPRDPSRLRRELQSLRRRQGVEATQTRRIRSRPLPGREADAQAGS